MIKESGIVGENSKIEWTDHTFNPWIGCTKVSEGCKHCYAETLMDKRYGRVEWGPQGARVRTSAANWKKPLAWNRKAAAEGKRARVFCASLADVFEDKPDQPEMYGWRAELFDMIELTPNLDWLLLTKRPENVMLMLPREWQRYSEWGCPPKNFWIGTSVENQEQADKRIPELLNIPAAVRFLSMEPLLGPVSLDNGETSWLTCHGACTDESEDVCRSFEYTNKCFHGIDWVIVGGESGAHARPMHPDWVRSIRDQCQAAGVPFFFKQWGEWVFENQLPVPSVEIIGYEKYSCRHLRQTPSDGLMAQRSQYRIYTNGGFNYYRVSKKKAGRLLDGREWNEFPEDDYGQEWNRSQVHHED